MTTSTVLAHFAQLGVDEGLMEQVLAAALAQGGEDAEIFLEHSHSTSLGLNDRQVNRASASVDLGAGLRVVVGDQVGYAYTEDLSPGALLQAARTAATIAHGGGSRRPGPVRVGQPADYYPLRRPWSEVSLTQRVPLVRAWEEAAFALDPRVVKVQASLADAETRVLIARADGYRVGDIRPMSRASLSCTVEAGGLRESGSFSLAGRVDLDWYDPARQQRLVERAVGLALRALEAGSPPAGEFPVVLAAGGSGILLHEAIGHGMEADFNRKGTSIYADRLGRPIAPSEVTIVDDATLPGARGSLNVDDEGSPTERTVLVQEGRLVSYLHDRISARHYGVAPTGNGRRESFRHPVLPRMRSTYMEPGPHDPADIIRSVRFGLYCETFANGSVQIGAGDFSFYVRHGRLIEDGRLTRPVKDVNLIGNGPRVLESIEMVGNDLLVDEGGWTCGKDGQGVPVSQGMPTVKVGNLSVGGGRG